MAKWTLEHFEFDLPRPSIKTQVLADFVTECTILRKNLKGMIQCWKTRRISGLSVDEASNANGSRAGLILTSLEEDIQYTLCFKFPFTNNKAKYEALIIEL